MAKKSKKKGEKRSFKLSQRSQKYIMVVLFVGVIGVLIGFVANPQFAGYFLPDDTTTTPTTNNFSTLSFVSYPEYEDISDEMPVNVLIPSVLSVFDDIEDIYDISLFTQLGLTDTADDITIDLRDYDYVYIISDPSDATDYETVYYLLFGGVNYDYTFNAYNLSSDVNFNLFDDSLAPVSPVGLTTDGTYNILFNVPSGEEDYCVQKSFFNPTDATLDAKQNMNLDLADITEAFAFRISCSDIVGDDDVTGINITYTDDDWYRINNGSDIYLIYQGTLVFTAGALNLEIAVEFGSAITFTDIDSGRLTIPGHKYDTGSLSFAKLSDIAS